MTGAGPGGRLLSERGGRARRDARRSRRRRAALLLAALVGGAIVFVAGVALGRALEQAPRPGGKRTQVRTLIPETVQPAPRTVTVTTTRP